MKSKRVFRTVLTGFGCALLLVSCAFLAISAIGYSRIQADPEEAVRFIEGVLPGRAAGVKEERTNSEMPAVTYDGQDYAALLTIPRFSVKLPVRAAWDKTAVKKVPCRFAGSAYDGTLIIGGIDRQGQFDFASQIDIGDGVTVTDMRGEVFTYTVTTVKHAKNAKAQTLTDGRYDLTLFARDKKTNDWLLIRCNMK